MTKDGRILHTSDELELVLVQLVDKNLLKLIAVYGSRCPSAIQVSVKTEQHTSNVLRRAMWPCAEAPIWKI